jgi:AraC-like DNA-binding protein
MNTHPTTSDVPIRFDNRIAELIGGTALPEEIVEAASLLSRLSHRAKMDPLMCRAARLLQRDPALSMPRLASQLGVSKDYLSRCLRAAFGTDPYRLACIAHNAKIRARSFPHHLQRHKS